MIPSTFEIKVMVAFGEATMAVAERLVENLRALADSRALAGDGAVLRTTGDRLTEEAPTATTEPEETKAPTEQTEPTAPTEPVTEREYEENNPAAQFPEEITDAVMREHMDAVFARIIGKEWETLITQDARAKKTSQAITQNLLSLARELGGSKPTGLKQKQRVEFLNKLPLICTDQDGAVTMLAF